MAMVVASRSGPSARPSWLSTSDFSVTGPAASRRCLELEPPVQAEEGGAGAEAAAEQATGTYARSVTAAADVMRAIAAGQGPNLRALKRTVQAIRRW